MEKHTAITEPHSPTKATFHIKVRSALSLGVSITTLYAKLHESTAIEEENKCFLLLLFYGHNPCESEYSRSGLAGLT